MWIIFNHLLGKLVFRGSVNWFLPKGAAMTSEEEHEKNFWDSWLDLDLGRELIQVREAVKRLYKEASGDPPLAFFTPHGPEHLKAVEDLFHRLIPMENYQKLHRMERFCLLASAWLHDLGMIRSVAEFSENRPLTDDEVRRIHHESSQKFIINHFSRCGLNPDCADVVGLLSRYHRRLEDLAKCPEKVMLRGEEVRVRLLAAYLRLADAMDIGSARVPEEAYAICLAYDIPAEVKLHWIKNKMVNAMRINPETHDITIEFRIPPAEQLGVSQSQRWVQERIQSVKALVCNDLREELWSVQNILRKEHGGFPFYLDIESDQFETIVGSQMANDLRELIINYDIMVFPTASKFIEMILITAANIAGFSLDEKQMEPTPVKGAKGTPKILERIDKFLTTAEEQILKNRPSHLGVKRLFDILRKTKDDLMGVDEDKKLSEFVSKLHAIYKLYRESRKCVRSKATLFFEDYYKSAEILKMRQFNILLYGNSELVTVALCGFRDALLKAIGENNPSIIFQSKAEELASRRLRLFVCEAQPKTQTGFGDRLTYHDGAQYSLYLKRYGFTNIIVIPDVISGHILEHIPIDFVLLGVDGITPDYFLHSAGHSTIVNIAREWRARNLEEDGGKATIVLVTSHLKWVDKVETEKGKAKISDEIVQIDGCPFWRGLSYGNGPEAIRAESREHVWIARDSELLKRLCSTGIAFFNPKGDRIPIDHVDFIITNKGSKCIKDPEWKTLF
jgi:translation initiation factor 2B subunit (eIF-2B alpha/beta/delta family)